MEPSKPHVVIMGAGMAGLSAAAQLSDSGLFDVTVLEAMERPGGRIHSTWEMGNTVLELGANWIHGTEGNPVYNLASKHNLLSEESSSSSSESSSDNDISSSEDSTAEWFQDVQDSLFFTEDGIKVPQSITKKGITLYSSIIEEIHSKYDEGASDTTKFDKTSIGQVLEQALQERICALNLDESEKRYYHLLFDWCMRQECVDIGCQTMKEVSAKHFHDYKALQGDYYCTLGEQGYQGVLDVLLKKIPDGQVQYNSVVDKIEWKGLAHSDGVSKAIHIKCENGSEFSADHVIITASVGYLKRNHSHLFFPALPDDKQRTLGLLQFGTINKIFLHYKKPFWKKIWKKADVEGIQVLWEEGFSNADSNQCEMVTSEGEIEKYFMKKIIGFDTVEKHPNLLVGWISGAEAEYLETLDDDKISEVCTTVLCKFLNNPRIPKPTKVLCTRWHSNPYVCGAYGAFLTTEASGDEYDIMMEPVYGDDDGSEDKEQCPLLLFAGEAYHKGFQSTTHGAMATGYSQADRLIAFYQSTSKK